MSLLPCSMDVVMNRMHHEDNGNILGSSQQQQRNLGFP